MNALKNECNSSITGKQTKNTIGLNQVKMNAIGINQVKMNATGIKQEQNEYIRYKKHIKDKCSRS